MDIEQCIGRSRQIPRTQHEQGYIDAICWLLQELEKRPVVVEQNANATDMNELHGEAYGVDWVYPAPSASEGWQCPVCNTDMKHKHAYNCLAVRSEE